MKSIRHCSESRQKPCPASDLEQQIYSGSFLVPLQGKELHAALLLCFSASPEPTHTLPPPVLSQDQPWTLKPRPK